MNEGNHDVLPAYGQSSVRLNFQAKEPLNPDLQYWSPINLDRKKEFT